MLTCKFSFFDEAKRITASDYIPNVSDVLRARTKTTGIYETRFTMGQLSIQYVGRNLSLLQVTNRVAQYVRRGWPAQ